MSTAQRSIETTGHGVRRVAVVGAGMAGLACAQVLAQAGCMVHVFDKSRGPSGRMSTRRAQDGQTSWQCDHGAPFFTARHPEFLAAVQQWQQAGVAGAWTGRLARYDGQGFSPLGTPQERFVGTPRMTAPAAHLANALGALTAPLMPVQLQLQTTIQALHRDTAGWQLTSAEHGHHADRYQAVLLAVPAPQAAPLLQPVAADAARLAAGVRMQGCWTLMVRCPQALDLPWDGLSVHQGPLRWVVRDSSKPGRDGPQTWVLQASAQWSEAHMEDGADRVTQMLLQAFAALGGPSPAGVQATAHRWRYANADLPLDIQSWWDPDAAVGLCGDWLHGGQVEGAWLSGRALAHNVLRSFAL